MCHTGWFGGFFTRTILLTPLKRVVEMYSSSLIPIQLLHGTCRTLLCGTDLFLLLEEKTSNAWKLNFVFLAF